MEEAPNVSVGARLQARDRVGKWYEATIIDQRGEDDLREVKVHFMGFSKRYDEWIKLSENKLASLDSDTPDVHEVERLLGKRKIGKHFEFLCRWSGFGVQTEPASLQASSGGSDARAWSGGSAGTPLEIRRVSLV